MIARSYCDETLPNSRRQTVVNVTNKLIIADSPLEDISGCRRPKDVLDILAGINFHLSLIQSFIWITAIFNKQRFYAFLAFFIFVLNWN